jgi:hypothetical protein
LVCGLHDDEWAAHAFIGAILTDLKACYPGWKARLAAELR